MMRKYACIVQGDIRRGTGEVLNEMSRHFDIVILSTWVEDKERIPKGSFRLLLNKKPPNPGFSNRNYQRLSVSNGLKYAERLRCTHILKWRTDIFPTKLDLNKLLVYSKFKVPNCVSSRIVTCLFRNLTVELDWFSTIPDLFAFSDMETMKLLWDSDGFDFSKDINPPRDMLEEYGKDWINNKEDFEFFPETELYANFRSRLEKVTNKTLNHTQIASEYMYLINHKELRICWFGQNKLFRSVVKAHEHPWWNKKVWINCNPSIVKIGHYKKWYIIFIYLVNILNILEIIEQEIWYAIFNRKKLNIIVIVNIIKNIVITLSIEFKKYFREIFRMAPFNW